MPVGTATFLTPLCKDDNNKLPSRNKIYIILEKHRGEFETLFYFKQFKFKCLYTEQMGNNNTAFLFHLFA